MSRHAHLHNKIASLRSQGLTYGEINYALGTSIPSSSLSYICRGVTLSKEQQSQLKVKANERLQKARILAVIANRNIFVKRVAGYRQANLKLAEKFKSRDIKLIALAMLYLGEGSKWKSYRGLALGSTDPRIILMYIRMLGQCYEVLPENMRACVQHRADQNPVELTTYWAKLTGIPKDRFYPCYVDKRTIGKPTTKPNYKGVCKISCPGTHIQLELEQIAVIISEALGI